MSLELLQKALRSLPYKDMVKLSEKLHEDLKKHSLGHHTFKQVLCPGDIADALLRSIEITVKPSEESQEEGQILSKLFVQKRQIIVKAYNTGFVVDIPTLRGSTVTTRGLRGGLQQCLDQIVTIKILRGGEYG